MSDYATLFRTGGFGLKRGAAPSGRLIDALLRHADVQEDLGDGRVRMRISRRRLRDRLVRADLGADASRADAVSLVFDDREGQVVQVAAIAPEPIEADDWSLEAERAYEAFMALRRPSPARLAA